MLRRLEADVLQMFAAGARAVFLVWDGQMPCGKAPTQRERQRQWLAGLQKKGRRPYRWPILDRLKIGGDDEEGAEGKQTIPEYMASDEFRDCKLFRDEQEIAASWNDVYLLPRFLLLSHAPQLLLSAGQGKVYRCALPFLAARR